MGRFETGPYNFMSLAEFSVQKKVTVVMCTLGMLLLGFISFTRLPQELFPPITFPQITIITNYANAAPEEVETLISRTIEEAVGSVAGLKRVESISREGRSTVTVSFNWGQDVDFAALAVREKIDLIKERLPKESDDPVVLKFDPLARPIMILSVSAPNLTPIQLKVYAEKIFKDNLEKVDGVASASISGSVEREILVAVDSARLEANHLSLTNVVKSIEDANISYPAGSIKKGLYEYLIRTVGEFRSVKDLEFAVVGADTIKANRKEDTSFLERGSKGPRETIDALREEVERNLLEKRLVLVRDIAAVTDGIAERTSVSRLNGKENIAISIQKAASANTIQVIDRVQKALAFLKPDMETRGLNYSIIYDHSIFIRKSLEDLGNDAMSGAVLAFIVLLLSLKAIGASLVVMLSVPVSVMATFFLLSMTGITLNTMSLGGLALASGMIVDASIVVLENIFRHRQLGATPYDAAVKGAGEVTWPVITSNATTIAVFVPLIVFVPGIPGQLFKDLSWAIIHSQIISTLVPLTVVPMLSIYLKVKKEKEGEEPVWHWTKPLDKFILSAATIPARVRNAGIMLISVFSLCSLSFFIFPLLEKEVLPKIDQGQFILRVEMPLSTRLEVTIGSEKSGKGQVQVDTLRASEGIILVTLEKERKRPSADVVHDLNEEAKKLNLEGGEVDFVLQESEFAFAEGGSKPISLEVRGYDFQQMSELVGKIKSDLKKIPGVINVQDDMAQSAPETRLNIDKRRAALYGISALDISLTGKAAIEGVVSTQYREAGKEYDIRVRLSDNDRNNIENLGNLLVHSEVLDSLIPLKEVASIERTMGPSEIKRVDQERAVVVTAEIEKTARSSDVLPAVQTTLANLKIAPESNLQVRVSGKAKEMKESFSKVLFAAILAAMLVYMLMAAQFESFAQPMIIMITVPLAMFGVLIALLISGNSVNVISALGMIILVGTVVNNGIVLVEYINQLRSEGMEVEEAALEASRVRTRPIIMSALSAVIGLIPLALGLGEGAALRSPMAVAMMGGSLSSTVLTLVVLPCFYIVVTRGLERLFGIPMDEEDLEVEAPDAPPPGPAAQ